MEKIKPGFAHKTPANRLLELREEKKLTQTEVAKLLDDEGSGYTPSVVSRHETGRKKIAHETVLKYTKIYKVEHTYKIFVEEGEPRRDNRLYELRMRSRLLPEEVQAVTGINPERLVAAEQGAVGLGHSEILRLAKLYKTWSYELFTERIGGEDAWQDGEYWIKQ